VRRPAANPTLQLDLPVLTDRPEPTPIPTDSELPELAGQFAGIDLTEFVLARQRARRVTLIWILSVLILTGLTAAAAWMAGTNLQALIG